MTKDKQNNLLEAVAGVFLRCFVLAVCLLLLWFVFYLLAGDWAYSIHSRWFELTRHEFTLMYYYLMAFIKIVTFLFFLFPYIFIKLILRKKQVTEPRT
jgi:heme/copper-type cytochrome/quinol oxidase subunit 2